MQVCGPLKNIYLSKHSYLWIFQKKVCLVFSNKNSCLLIRLCFKNNEIKMLKKFRSVGPFKIIIISRLWPNIKKSKLIKYIYKISLNEGFWNPNQWIISKKIVFHKNPCLCRFFKEMFQIKANLCSFPKMASFTKVFFITIHVSTKMFFIKKY